MGGFFLKSNDALLPRKLLNRGSIGDWWHRSTFSWTSQMAMVTIYWTLREDTKYPWTLLSDDSQPQLWTLLQSNHWAVGKYQFYCWGKRSMETQTYRAPLCGQERNLHLSTSQSTASEAAWTELWVWMERRYSLKDADVIWPEWSIDQIPFNWKTRGIGLRNSAGDMPYISCHVGHWENHLWQWLEKKKRNSEKCQHFQ